jgi:hypothetical protein
MDAGQYVMAVLKSALVVPVTAVVQGDYGSQVTT